MDFSKDLEVIDKKLQDSTTPVVRQEPTMPMTESVTDKKQELIDNMFNSAVGHQVATNEDLKQTVLDTAKTYTETKMQVIKTDVDTDYKKAVYNNNIAACESYGLAEDTTPTWAIRIMNVGYSIMLAIYIFFASFTVMPIIFLCKKISVGLKKTWVAAVFAVLIYLLVVFVPIIIGVISGKS